MAKLGRKPPIGKALISVTREQHSFARRRVEFLTDAMGLQTVPLMDLLANAYVQGLVDATETYEARSAMTHEPKQ